MKQIHDVFNAPPDRPIVGYETEIVSLRTGLVVHERRFYGFSRTVILCSDIRTENGRTRNLSTYLGPQSYRACKQHWNSECIYTAQKPLDNALVLRLSP